MGRSTKNKITKREELSVYEGQYVRIHLKNISIGVDHEEVIATSEAAGYVIEVGNYFLHLGDTPHGFNRSINIIDISVIEAEQPPVTTMIVDGDVVPNKEDLN